MFEGPGSNAKKGPAHVVVAERRFEHYRQYAYGDRLHFALVLLSDGRTRTWHGDPEQYASLLETGSSDSSVLSEEVFWRSAASLPGG